MKNFAFIPIAQFKVEVYEHLKKLWKWRIIHRNRKIVAGSSEGFVHKHDCVSNLGVLAEAINTYCEQNDLVPVENAAISSYHKNSALK